MASVNKVIIVGNLGKDPETRFLPNGDAVCNIVVATSETWIDKNTNEKREDTEWHRIVFFRKTAEIADKYLKKGSQVYVEGSLKTRKWQDKDGNDRYTTEIRGDRMQMLGGKSGGDSGDRAQQQADAYQRSAGSSPAPSAPNQNPSNFDDLDDIPF